jgi:nicotinate phosphoribosyltransferase
MSGPTGLYRPSLALLTDLYELTMAQGYWKAGVADHGAVFHMSFRESPFRSGYTVCAGLAYVVDYLERFSFADDDLAYLAELRSNDGAALFEPAFLDYLRTVGFRCDVDALPEGTVVFPQEPLVRVRGPILQAQLLETSLLNLINFQSLIATKAARICVAARSEPVIEFGLRRAQGIDGGIAASRAAYVGGCAATSNVLAGKLLGIPVRGTHAHSWVMFFDDEEEAFRQWARAMPNHSVFLVDTYDSLQGVRRAVATGRWLREQGHEMAGIRLDSGDLAYLSVEARRILDQAGFQNAVIVASNDLDEQVITSLKQQGAAINVWGVGTRLVTAYDQPALGGVYKLTAVRHAGKEWEYKLKLSEQAAKISTPGILQVRRYAMNGQFIGDLIYDEMRGVEGEPTMVDPLDLTRRKRIPRDAAYADLLVPVFRGGKRVYDSPPLERIRDHARRQLEQLHAGIKRFLNPHEYPVGLEPGLHELKLRLILEARERTQRSRK